MRKIGVLVATMLMVVMMVTPTLATDVPKFEVQKSEWAEELTPIYVAEFDNKAEDGFNQDKLLNNGQPVITLKTLEGANPLTVANDYWESKNNTYDIHYNLVSPFGKAVKVIKTSIDVVEQRIKPASKEEIDTLATKLTELHTLENEIKTLEDKGESITEEEQVQLKAKKAELKPKQEEVDKLRLIVEKGHLVKDIVTKEHKAILILVTPKFDKIILKHHIVINGKEDGVLIEDLFLGSDTMYNNKGEPIFELDKLAGITHYKQHRVYFEPTKTKYDDGLVYNKSTYQYDQCDRVLHLYYTNQEPGVVVAPAETKPQVTQSTQDNAEAKVDNATVKPSTQTGLPATGESGLSTIMATWLVAGAFILLALAYAARPLVGKLSKSKK